MGAKRNKKRQVHVRAVTARSSPRQDPSHSSPLEAQEDISPVSVNGERDKTCRHHERGVDLEKLSGQLGKSKLSLSLCHDCLKESKGGPGKKGKGRSNRKKSLDSLASDQTKKWICLACGHVGCSPEQEKTRNLDNSRQEGPTKGHALKHSLIAKHPLALSLGSTLECWCFLCNMTVDYCLNMDEGKQLDCGHLREAAKLVQEKIVKESDLLKTNLAGVGRCFDGAVADVSLKNGTSLWSLVNKHCPSYPRKRIVKGLINLGNTCFFNSVMQNLLALDMLREHFSQNAEVVEGPLTSSLRQLFMDTNLDGSALKVPLDSSSLKEGAKLRTSWEISGRAYNPRSLFSAICTKAPRFRGFQQQDSHELLRCLLEVLNSEEQNLRSAESCKSAALEDAKAANGLSLLKEREKESFQNGRLKKYILTLVDSLFEGQLSSIVRCCDCGHSSVVYEPILDLSLQIPSKLTSRKGQGRVNQGLKGRFQKGSIQHDLKRYKVVKQVDSATNSSSQIASESKVVSLQVLPCTQSVYDKSLAPHNNAFSEPSLNSDPSLEDNGWLDFVGGGTCSAEGSVRGLQDTVYSPETVDTGQSGLSCQPMMSLCSSSVEGMGESASDLVPSNSSHAGDSGLAGNVSEMEKVDNNVNDEEDVPLPMASGILMLPYEPLCNGVVAESQSLDIKTRNENEASFTLQGGDKVPLPSLHDLDNNEFDGFSQLFEEEETVVESKQDLNVGGNFGSLQVTRDASFEGDWEGCVGNSAENDHMTDSQTDAREAALHLSLEGCLTDFTKCELLSGENAWECENCTRLLKEKMLPLVSDDALHVLSASSISKEGIWETKKEDGGLECNGVDVKAHIIEDGKVSYLHECILQGQNGGCDEIAPLVAGGGSCAWTAQCNSELLKRDVDAGTCDSSNARLNNLFHGQPHERQSFHTGKASREQADITLVMNTASPSTQNKCQPGGVDVDRKAASAVPAPLLTTQINSLAVNSMREDNLELSDSSSIKHKIMPLHDKYAINKSHVESQQRVKRDAIKRLLISKAPPILTIHLKRFAQDLHGCLNKLTGHVSFPEVLDLRPFLDSKCLDLDNCIYRLVGIVEHGGTMRGGHYIAYVRGPLAEESNDHLGYCWYCISDSIVHKSSLQAVLNSEAYLLFYEKCAFNKS